ncbi:hypothetical protein M406DRAFT_274574, partial [Cryphonectria parasitica EP155]
MMDEKGAYFVRLRSYVVDSLNKEEDFHFLRFEFLQRLNITNIEVELAEMKTRMLCSQDIDAEDLENLRVKLEQYATALRDYQYLRNKTPLAAAQQTDRRLRLHKYFHSAASLVDPWNSHYAYFRDDDSDHHLHGGSSIDPLRTFLRHYLPSRLTFSRHERHARAREYAEGKPPREVSPFVDSLARFVIAIVGGVVLVVPMIVMIFQPSQTKSLISVSVAVVLFSLLLSFGIKVSNVETLVSTATYAAVLVVFVGTSSGVG